MTEEEKKAIETIKNFIKYYKKNEQTGNRANLDVLGEEIEAIQIALNLIQNQDTEINKLNNVIHEITNIDPHIYRVATRKLEMKEDK